ncbi:monogalactosyldiacylglycerol (mgdg) synthase [Lucifera butyrica]|uniref:Monogalactosyldiacylglycerol (Mgdg) synthase n=1 Tax=Lucifera butyrica TaxID=1351585 RepID=A0A498R4M3_9FIRM|nr:glycosyltransferase [Lucifera butyrica]VBB06391.1 monogalactosyldiacylglycerol (mgdg) synthase [Lucifera butyrica]
MLSKVTNILIVSASVGAGHTQAAQAVRAEIERQNPLARVHIVDFMAGQNSYLNTLLKETYLKMIDIFPNMYDLLYRWSQVPHPGTEVRTIMAQAMKHAMNNLLHRYAPDFLIFTHPFPCAAASYLKRTGKHTLPMAAVVTDFAVHRLWIDSEVDFYFVATRELRSSLEAAGVLPRRIFVTGIPIRSQFRHCGKSSGLRADFGLNRKDPVLLVMGGGLGLGAMKEALLHLNKVPIRLQIVVVAGRNPELKNSLASLMTSSPHHVRILGYTEQIAELMATADLLITKPGALTISEALAMNLPLLFFDSLPGQEEENAAYLSAKGAAVWLREQRDLTPSITHLLSTPAQLASLREHGRQFSHPAAASHIAGVLLRAIIATPATRSNRTAPAIT